MKKLLSLLLVISLVITNLSTYAIAETYDEVATEAVHICTTIGMVQGTGNGVTEEYLDTTPARYQGAVLLLKLKGIYTEASTFNFADNYSDYTDLSWSPEGHNMLGYLMANPDVGFAGYPDGTFLPNDSMTAKQYYKLMLESLGYEYGLDYTWDVDGGSLMDVMSFAEVVGLTWLQDNDDFTMRDLCIATAEALKAHVKDGSMTLAEELEAEGAIDYEEGVDAGLFEEMPIVAEPEVTIDIENNYEIAMILGNSQMTIRVEDGTFKDEIGSNSDETQDLISGIAGSLASEGAFNETVSLDYTNVTRVSDSEIVIDFGVISDYAIDENEEITVIIPTSVFNETVEEEIEVNGEIVDCGSGDAAAPWYLFMAEDFEFIRNNEDTEDYYIMLDDMNFNDVEYTPIELFEGVLYGNDHVIYNLEITSDASDVGMFSEIKNAAIMDLSIVNSELTASEETVGMIAGTAIDSTISKIYIQNSKVTVTGDPYDVGGMFGNIQNTILISCSAVNIELNCSGEYYGGLFGYGTGGSVEGCLISGAAINSDESAITGLNNIAGGIGGAAHDVTINNCQFVGEVNGYESVGGIVGSIYDSIITKCNTYGSLYAKDEKAGGIVGEEHFFNDFSTLTGNYCGLDYIMSDSIDVDDLFQHRIIGQGNVTRFSIENDASGDTKLYDAEMNDYSDSFISDVDGLDGYVSIFYLRPFYDVDIIE